MGGYGSGRHSGRATTGTALPLTVRAILTYGGLVRWSRRGEPLGSIGYRFRDSGPRERTIVLEWSQRDGQQYTQTLRLVALPMRFGGLRWWWTCPHCDRRRATLYYPARTKVWACRTCYRLSYPVQNENPTDRAFRRWDRVAARLGVRDLVPADAVDMASADWIPPRPKGMRQHTYARLSERWEFSLYATANGLGRQLGSFLARSGFKQ